MNIEDEVRDLRKSIADINLRLNSIRLAAIGQHNILSVDHPDADPAAVTEGAMIRGNATPEWETFGPGDEDDILTIVGGIPNWAAPSGAVDDEGICFYDEFADASRFWTWYDMNLSAATTIVESGSVLTIAVTAGTTTDIWSGVNSAPSALMGVLEGCCRIETKINNQTVNTDTGRGVYLAIPSGTAPGSYYHVFLCRNTAGVAVEFSGVASVYTDADKTLPMWFRIDILTLADMRIFRFYKSTDGTSWTLVYSAINGMNVLQGRHMSVGLYVKNWTGNAVSCPFEYFKQYRPRGPR